MTNGVAAVGECMLELSRQSDGAYRLGFAGDTFNTLWTLRALLPDDRDAVYVSAFGDDPFSAEQIAFFGKAGIGIGSSPVIPGARPGLYAITLTGAERSFTYWRSDAAARRLADDTAALSKNLDGRALVYFSGITLAILDGAGRTALFEALAETRQGGATIAFDPNYRPRLWAGEADARAAFAQALELCDIALPTFPDEQALQGDASPRETAERMQKAGVAEVVVKNGSDPAFLATASGTSEIAATAVANPVDTTGAGDSFNGAYLAARLGGLDPAAAVAKAHLVAGAVIQVRGALAPFETLGSAFGQA